MATKQYMGQGLWQTLCERYQTMLNHIEKSRQVRLQFPLLVALDEKLLAQLIGGNACLRHWESKRFSLYHAGSPDCTRNLATLNIAFRKKFPHAYL